MARKWKAGVLAGALALSTMSSAYAGPKDGQRWDDDDRHKIRHVLLLSIDGMHALDFENCVKGINTVNGGNPYCPNLAGLAEHGVNYLKAATTKPSDSFPGMAAQFTGGESRSTGFYYDVSYNRALSPPAQTTPYGIVGGANLCPGTVGTQVGFDEQIDFDLSKLNGGGGINPAYLPRDPKNGCAPVYPHSYLLANTIFEVVKAAGGYTAWSDKHPSYEFSNGPSGHGVDDFFGPEINSVPQNLPDLPNLTCNPLPDQLAVSTNDDYTTSFQNIKCYDGLKVGAILNEISGLTHDGTAHARVPNVFGMNFQAVSVGEKLHEKAIGLTGGYLDALGTPSASLLSEIEFVDNSIGRMVEALKNRDLYESTLIIISAKHGQSPIDPNRVFRITTDDPTGKAPSDILGGIYDPVANPSSNVAQAIEDDVSLIWLRDETKTVGSVATLSTKANAALAGIGEIFSGPSIDLMFNDPSIDPRTPDIIVAPNVGVVYTGGTKKIAEHGGFANDDTNVILLVSNLEFLPQTVTSPVETTQIAPTILQALGLDPDSLQAVKKEHTSVLPGLKFDEEGH